MAYIAPRAYQEYTDIVEIAFGYTSASDLTTAVWTDISRYVRGTITITKGKANLANDADPTQISLTLDDSDGRFTAGNPMSPYWPNVVRNVPLRVRRTWKGAGGTYERATAFVNGWPLQPVAGVAYVTVDIVATGRLRRLRRTGKIVSSALKRTISTIPNLRAYWPMEDGSTVTESTPAVGLWPLTVVAGTASFGADGPPGGQGGIDFTSSLVMRGPVTGGSGSSWRVMFAWSFTGTSGDIYPMSWVCSDGSMFVPRFVAGGGVFTLNLDYVTGSGTFTQAFACPWSNTDPTWHFFQLTAVQSGADVDIAVAYDDAAWHPSTPTAILTGTTLSPIRSMRPGAYSGIAPPSTAFSLAHLAVASPSSLNPSLTSPDLANAVTAYAGEDAVTRATRLCAENGVPLTTVSGTVPAQVMGPQSVQTLASLLAECEDVDGGLLHDGGTLGNLVYISGTAFYNAAPQFTLDYRRGQIGDGYAGTLDDQDLVNVWQISRTNGGSATSTGVASLAIDDEYDQQASPNVNTDAQLQPIADWRNHVSSYEAMRFPAVTIDLRRSPELVLPATTLALPARINPINVPLPYPPAGSMDQFGIGYTEVLDAVTWQIGFNCTPWLPYRIAVIQDATNPWVIDANGSTCNNATATATSLTVATPSAPLWSTAAGDYPRDVNINGEQVTVTAVSGSSSPQTFTVKRSINGVVKAISGNPAVTLWHPAAIAL